MTNQTSTKYFSNKQENMIARLLNWTVVKGSGARSLHPGDIQSDVWLGECKTHETPGHKIIFNQRVWKKIVDEAVSKYRFPALFVDDGSQTIMHTWVMYSCLPSIPVTVVNFPHVVKTNVSFDSLDMLDHRKHIDGTSPVIYTVSIDRVAYISTLEDFHEMFK